MQSYFDPKTGELIGGEIGSEPQNNSQYQQNNQWAQQQNFQQSNQWAPQQSFQEPEKQKTPLKGSPKKLLLGLGIGGGILAIVGIVIFVVSRLLMSNPLAKISTATLNTFKGGELISVFNPIGIMNPEGMVVELVLEAEGDKIGLSTAYQQSKAGKIANAKVDMDIAGEALVLEGTIELDKEKLAFNVPQMNDTVYTYYYTKKNDGFLTEELDDEVFEILNEALAKAYEYGYSKTSEKAQEAFRKLITDEISSIETEELKKETFEVNGKDVQCGGYFITVTEDNILNIVNGLADIYDEYYADSMDEMLEEMDMDIEDVLKDMEDSFEDIPDIELSFYLYKEQLACFKMEADGEEEALCVYFYGGDYPAQNMEVILDDGDDEYSALKIKGLTKNRVETVILEIAEKEFCEINYNQKTGELEVSGKDYGKFDLSAVVNRKDNTLTFKVDELEIDGVDASGSIVISGDVNLKSLKGKEFDLGNASEDDFEDLAEELEDFMDDNELLYDLF